MIKTKMGNNQNNQTLNEASTDGGHMIPAEKNAFQRYCPTFERAYSYARAYCGGYSDSQIKRLIRTLDKPAHFKVHTKTAVKLGNAAERTDISKAIPALEKALEHSSTWLEDVSESKALMKALLNCKSRDVALDALVRLLGSGRGTTRGHAAAALLIGENNGADISRAKPALEENLNDEKRYHCDVKSTLEYRKTCMKELNDFNWADYGINLSDLNVYKIFMEKRAERKAARGLVHYYSDSMQAIASSAERGLQILRGQMDLRTIELPNSFHNVDEINGRPKHPSFDAYLVGLNIPEALRKEMVGIRARVDSIRKLYKLNEYWDGLPRERDTEPFYKAAERFDSAISRPLEAIEECLKKDGGTKPGQTSEIEASLELLSRAPIALILEFDSGMDALGLPSNVSRKKWDLSKIDPRISGWYGGAGTIQYSSNQTEK